MPEGDTIFRAARTLNRVLAGHVVTRFESVLPALNRIDVDRPIAGRTIEAVTARGKHLLISLSGDVVLRTHMRMNGSWHVYPAGAQWQRPAREMRVLIATARAVAVGFNIPEAEFLTARSMARHPALSTLGPDLLGERVDSGEVARRMRARAGDPISDVLLDQRVAAGIGNVLKSETLFVARVHPFTPVSALDDDRLRRVIASAVELLRVSVADRRRTHAPAEGRRTTRSLHPQRALWVYGRANQPCRACGTPIASRKTGPDARLTYWCPRCQGNGARPDALPPGQ